ncbi:MAG: hypothetical protein G01um10147_33 [Microgenomates group bacterium Gr01-1014_7]|nr:MAG: hypothetical protein G01um10147_33 [Microgenomates group bacterium Gr01-1014_7]
MSVTKLFTLFPPFIYYAMLLLIVGIFVFNKTFHLSLIGDEWQMMWIVKNSVVTTGQWDLHINQTFGQGYRMGALIMYLLTEYFGYDGKTVYIFSFITRFFATLTLFYFLRKRGCSYLAAFLGSLFFLVTPIGLQATDWAKNFTSYISISFFLLCIDSIYSLKSWRSILFFLLTFSISIYVNPIRSHGIILTTTFLLIFQYFFSRSVDKKRIIFSLFCSLAIFFLFLKMLVFGGITIGQIETLFGSIGAALLPQPSLPYLILLVVTLLLWKRYLVSKKYLLFTLSLHTLIIPIFFGTFLNISNDKLFAILGIYFTLFMIYVFIIELSNKKTPEALNAALPFLLIICFLIAPWLVGTPIVGPTHRYLIYSALSLPIIVAFSLNQNMLLKLRSISFCITSLFLLMFYLSLKSDINEMYSFHNQNTAKIIWQQIAPYFDNYDFKNHTPVVFFDSNNEAAIVHDVVTFGFGFHMGYIYKIWVYDIKEMNNKLPIAVDSLADFTSMVTDGKVIKKYVGKDAKPFIFPKADAFYFKIDNLKVTRVEDF